MFFLREENLKLSPEQKHALATVNSLFGGVLLHSDDMAKWTDEAKAAYRQLLRNREATNVKVHADHGLSVTYDLDGESHRVVIE